MLGQKINNTTTAKLLSVSVYIRGIRQMRQDEMERQERETWCSVWFWFGQELALPGISLISSEEWTTTIGKYLQLFFFQNTLKIQQNFIRAVIRVNAIWFSQMCFLGWGFHFDFPDKYSITTKVLQKYDKNMLIRPKNTFWMMKMFCTWVIRAGVRCPVLDCTVRFYIILLNY